MKKEKMQGKTCRECGAPIPRREKNCPRCGLEQIAPRRYGKLINLLGAAGIAMVVFFVCLFTCSGEDKRFEAAGKWQSPSGETVEIFYVRQTTDENALRKHASGRLSSAHPYAVFYYTHPAPILRIEGSVTFEKALEIACRNRPEAATWHIPHPGRKDAQKFFRMYPSYPLTPENETIQTDPYHEEKPTALKWQVHSSAASSKPANQ